MLTSPLPVGDDVVGVRLQGRLPFFRRVAVLVVKVGDLVDGWQFMEDVSSISR